MPILSDDAEAALAFRSIQRTTVVEAIRDQLMDLLDQRKLRPGDMLPSERELRLVLNVGRSSLREALSGLVALGMLTSVAGKGYRVCSLTPPVATVMQSLHAAQVAELFEVRRLLEVGIAELACLRATEADFADMEACLESIKRAHRARRSTAPVTSRFHALLANASHNGLLVAQLQGIRDLMTQVGLKTEQQTGSHFAEEQWEAHKTLLDTLRTRDTAAMRQAMLDHLDRFASEAEAATEESSPD